MNKYLRDPKFLLFNVEDRVARITLNRPDKRNSLSPSLLTELRDALLEADGRIDVNVVILEGAGKDFCAGYDLVGSYAGFKDGEPLEHGADAKAHVTGIRPILRTGPPARTSSAGMPGRIADRHCPTNFLPGTHFGRQAIRS
jgi:1,4-dihydroxy-2-naphthoyl-CoA synthase